MTQSLSKHSCFCSQVINPIIRVNNLTVAYGNEVVLENVSFEIGQGEIVAVLGRSGCGKTTLFKAMIGLIEPAEGEILIDGEKVIPISDGGSEKVLRKIGVLFQSGALFSSMSIAENIALPLHQYTSLPERIIENIVKLKLTEVGLGGSERMSPSELSGGMQKRAALARAMALDPKILFFDEPSAGLDPVTSAALDETISQINHLLNTTMIVVTHELPSIFSIAHRVIMLEKRKLIACGDPRELMEKSTDPVVLNFFHRSTSKSGKTKKME